VEDIEVESLEDVGETTSGLVERVEDDDESLGERKTIDQRPNEEVGGERINSQQ